MATPLGRFPRQQRVRKRPEFQRIQANARRVTTPRFVFLLFARSDHAGARLGVTVSRKVGSAPVRNRAKRLIREAFRSTRELWPNDVDLVVVARRSTDALALAAIVSEWQAVEPALKAALAQARRDRERRAETVEKD